MDADQTNLEVLAENVTLQSNDNVAFEPVTVCPFTIVIDNREKSPFHFRRIEADASQGGGIVAVPVETRYLPTGDYSIIGMEDIVCVERKSKEDLFGSLGRNRKRFEAEIKRMQDGMEFGAVVVESDFAGIVQRPPENTRMAPKSVIRSIISWGQRYPKVHWYLAGSRFMAEVMCYRILERFWRGKNERSSV